VAGGKRGASVPGGPRRPRRSAMGTVFRHQPQRGSRRSAVRAALHCVGRLATVVAIGGKHGASVSGQPAGGWGGRRKARRFGVVLESDCRGERSSEPRFGAERSVPNRRRCFCGRSALRCWRDGASVPDCWYRRRSL
jgi:hypothetical protein